MQYPAFRRIKRTDFRQDAVEFIGDICYSATSGFCFINYNISYTGNESVLIFLDFIRVEKRRSNIKSKAVFQPFCTAHKFNLVYFKGKRAYPRSVTERSNAFFSYNNAFCIIWKSDGVSFNRVIVEINSTLQ